MTAVRIRDLTVELGGRFVLDHVDLDVASGAWVSVVGPNGAGKTTLVRAVAGMATHRSGTVEVAGVATRSISSRARARLVAVVPQSPVIPAGVTVLDYALLGRTPHLPYFGRERESDVVETQRLLDRLGIAELAGRSVETLSGGERQRVVLARALLQDAPVVLLDEPTSALDIGHQQDVLELVEELRQEQGLTVITTMHDLTLAGLFADELVLLADGRIAERGPAEAVLTEQHLRDHFGARVSVLRGEDGPVVVPARLPRRPPAAPPDERKEAP